MQGVVKVVYKKLKPTKKNGVNWKRVLLMYFSLIVLIGIAVMAYDGANQYIGLYEYPGDNDAPVYISAYPYNEDKSEYKYFDYYYIDEHGYHMQYDNYIGAYANPPQPEYTYEDDAITFIETSTDIEISTDYQYEYDTALPVPLYDYDNYSGYIGYAPSYLEIMPLSDVYVGNLADFRAAIVGAQPNMPITINLTNHIAFSGGNPGAGVGGNTSAGTFVIGGDRHITIRSAQSQPITFALGQNTSSGRYHFIVESGATLVLENVILQRTVPTGAAAPTTVAAAPTSFNTAAADGRGGVLVTHNGTFIMNQGTEIRGMRGTSPSSSNVGGGRPRTGNLGGAVQVNGNNAHFIMNGGRLWANVASNGGAVAVLNGTFTMNNGNINHNRATSGGSTSGGGGVVVQGANATFHMLGGVVGVEHNIAPGDLTLGVLVGGTGTGGGAWAGGSAIGNDDASGRGGNSGTGTSVGGGVLVRSSGHFILEGGMVSGNASNRGTFAGGGVRVASSGRLTMPAGSTGSIRGNFAAGSGGGLYVRGTIHIHMNGGYIENNRSARTGSNAGGGGVLLEGATFNMGGGTVRNNTTSTLRNSTTAGNTPGTGGGFRIRGGSVLRMTGGYITGNTAGWGGGGVYMSTAGSSVRFYMYGGTVDGNSTINVGTAAAVRHGGGIYINDGIFHLRGHHTKNILHNSATGNGGGIFWGLGNMTITLNTGEVNIGYNTATNGGGAVIDGAGFVANRFNFFENTAHVNGGGLQTTHTVTFSNSTFRENIAGSNGGAVNLTGAAQMTVNNTEFIENQAGSNGGAISSGATMNLNNSRLNNNWSYQRGGAVHVTGGTLNVTGTHINYNEALGTGVADSGGGGIFISGGNIILNNYNRPIVSPGTVVTGDTLVLTDTHVINHTTVAIAAVEIGGNMYAVDGSNVVISGGTNVIITERAVVDEESIFFFDASLNANRRVVFGEVFDIDGSSVVQVGSATAGVVHFGSVVENDAEANITVTTTQVNIDGEIFLMGPQPPGTDFYPSTLIWLSAGRAIFADRTVSLMPATTATAGAGIHRAAADSDSYPTVVVVDEIHLVNVPGGVQVVSETEDGETTTFIITTREYTISSQASIYAVEVYGEVHTINNVNVILNSAGTEVTIIREYYIDGESITHDVDANTIVFNNLINRNEALFGGGILMMGTNTSAGAITMNGGIIRGNHAHGTLFEANTPHGGGGIYVAGTGVFGLLTDANVTRPASTFNMNGGLIIGNEAERGGGVFIGSGNRASGNNPSGGGTFNLGGGVIEENFARVDGGGVFMNGGTRGNAGSGNALGSIFNQAGGEISGNRAAGNGGGVFLQSGLRVTGTTGGGMAHGATFNMSGGYIGGNMAGFLFDEIEYPIGSGEYIPVVSSDYSRGGGVYMQGVTVTNSTTVSPAIAAQTTHSRFNLSGSGNILGNTATGHGGGVFVGGGIRLGDSTGAAGNTGDARGGNFIMEGGHISGNNTVNSHGGGVYVEGGTDTSAGTAVAHGGLITMTGGAITNNRALNGNGGGVFLIGNDAPSTSVTAAVAAALTIDGTGEISGNEALRGGGVFVGGGIRRGAGSGSAVINGALLTITQDGDIRGNTATWGGGVYVDGGIREGDGTMGGALGGTLRIGDNNPSAATSGFYNSGSISGNIAHEYGGGIVLRPGRDAGTQATVNTSTNYPGARLTVNGGRIMDNTAETDGGGIWISNTAGENNVPPSVSAFAANANIEGLTSNFFHADPTIMRAHIIGNTATTGNGGGIWIAPGLEIFIINSHVHANSASVFGGGIFIPAGTNDFQGSTLTMRGGYISGAAYRGGGIYIQGGSGTGLSATEPAIFVMENTTLVTQSQIGLTGSVAVVNAGVAPTIGLPAVSTHTNGMADYGGGVYIQGGSAPNNAGRFYMRSGSIGAAGYTVYGSIRGNLAKYDGGGLYIGLARAPGAQDAQFIVTGNAGFAGNVAGRHGGGIFVPSNFNLSNTFSNNQAHIMYNQAQYGGGIFLSPGAVLHLDAGSIVRGNNADNDGGGVYVSGGRQAAAEANGAVFTLYGGDIGGTGYTNASGGANHTHANSAQRGGGVFVQHGITSNNGGTFELENGNIIGNQAVYGGGVFIGDSDSDAEVDDDDDNGGVVIPAGSEATPYDINIAPHLIGIAPFSAEGLGGLFTMTNGIINSNQAGCDSDSNNIIVGSGGGVWVANYGYFYATDVDFTNNRAIGVLPEDGRPINGMGGAIFTMRHEYADPLRRVLPTWLGADTRLAYSNIRLLRTNFYGNSAASLEWPPYNSASTNWHLFNPITGTTSQGNVADHDRHPLNNYDINFTHGTIAQFRFFLTCPKLYDTDVEINPISGPQFLLFRTISTAPPDFVFDLDPDGHFIRFNPSTGESLSALWEERPFANGAYVASSSNTAISFEMDTRFFYQLVQINTHPGFQLPTGQWRIIYDVENTPPSGTQPFTVTAVAGNAPQFISSIDARFAGLTLADHPLDPYPYDSPQYFIWYVGSLIDFELPLTGSRGTISFTAAGFSVVGLAMFTALWFFVVQKGKYQYEHKINAG